jgi:ubiquinone/menaquinone biosynthesis C-methylase UbiE
MNLENLLLDSNQYNIVVCYHVLDYLNNDIKGMSEIHRVLAPEGITITQEGVDFQAEKTTEWQQALPENEYRIRQYGVDFFDKWKSVGFEYLLVQGHGLSSPVLISSKLENSAALRSLETLLRTAGYLVLTNPRAIPS